jgi:hypothetical protein
MPKEVIGNVVRPKLKANGKGKAMGLSICEELDAKASKAKL